MSGVKVAPGRCDRCIVVGLLWLLVVIEINWGCMIVVLLIVVVLVLHADYCWQQ